MQEVRLNHAHHEAKHKKKKRNILLALLATFLLVAVIAATLTVSHKNTINIKAHAHDSLIESTCASTLYPDLCVSSLINSPSTKTSKLTNSIDVISAALNLTISRIQLNKAVIKKIASRKNLTPREVTALEDCLETADDSIAELQKVSDNLRKYLSKNRTIDDLVTLLSAAMTNQETCIDGFSHDKADKKLRQGLLEGQRHNFKQCSNVLAMVKNMTASNAAVNGQVAKERRLEESIDEHGWPTWLSTGDRKLLQATTITPDVTVAADGTGNFLTISQAVAAAPSRRTTRYIIRIKAGTYRENVEVPRGKTNLMFVGDGRTNTIITGSRSVGGGSTTFNSATVAVVGDGFLARDVTFQNTAGPSNHQAVALRVNADLTAFYRCDMIGFQDTLYTHSLRQFYVNCIIIGTVDFIFGNAAVVIQNCDIHARRPNRGQRNMVTAQGRDDPNENTGIVIQRCRIGATSDLQGQQGTYPTFLGRPWKLYSRTVIMQSEISEVINPAGWYEWSGNFALNTLFYAEYANTGPGADTSNRVNWAGYRVLTSPTQAQPFTVGNFISGANWLPATGFPFSLGL